MFDTDALAYTRQGIPYFRAEASMVFVIKFQAVLEALESPDVFVEVEVRVDSWVRLDAALKGIWALPYTRDIRWEQGV